MANKGAPDFFKAILLFGMGPEGVPLELKTDEEGNLRVNIIPHHVTHEAGGSDEVNVQDLKGVLANLQWAKWSIYDVRANFPTTGLEVGALGYATDEGALYRWDGAAWNKVLSGNFLNLSDTPASYAGAAGYVVTVNQAADGLEFRESAPPGLHADTHQAGGADEINVEGLSGVLADHQWAKISVYDAAAYFPPAGIAGRIGYATDEGRWYYDTGAAWTPLTGDPILHAARHQPGGSDAIPTATPSAITEGAAASEGTSTALARADHVHATPSSWTPSAHATTHQDGGSDEINVEGLSGVLADHQWAKISVYAAAASFPAAGIAGRIGYATDEGKWYYDTGAAWTPLTGDPIAHAARHQPGGSDAIPTGTPSTITEGASASEGTSTALARADHVHGTPATWTPSAHAANHEAGGSDAINPANIGADWTKLVNVPSTFPPTGHKASHQDGGSDEISVEGLSGVLADHQWAKISVYTTKVGFPAAGISGRIGYATDEGKWYYDNGTAWVALTGDPIPHAARHAYGGSDALSQLDTGEKLSQLLPTDGSRPLTGDWDAGAARYIYNGHIRPAKNTFRANLGDPTVFEVGLIDAEYTNKLAFHPPELQEESTDGVTWVTSSRLTSDELKNIMIGQGNVHYADILTFSAVGEADYYRLTWDGTGIDYVCLNALYLYITTQGNTVNIKIEGKAADTGEWVEIASGNVRTWPGHVFVEHDRIRWYPASTAAGFYTQVRVTFSVTSSSTTNPVRLGSLEWRGAHPAGRSDVEIYDGDKNVTFPAGMTINGPLNTNGGTINGVDVTAHAARHQPGGADAIPTGIPSTITEGAAASQGTSTSLARADHVHATPSSWTPSAHAATHNAGGSDALDVGNLVGTGAPLTQVFSGTSPTVWTDLNLSSVVGANAALVVLKVKNRGSTNYNYWFRRNGDTDKPSVGYDFHSANVCTLAPGEFGYVVLVTDTSGRVEWRTGQAHTVTIWVEGYIRLS